MAPAQRQMISPQLRVARAQPQRFLTALDRGLDLAQPHQRPAELNVGVGIIRVERDRCLEFEPTFIEPVLLAAHHAHCGMRERAAGVLLECL